MKINKNTPNTLSFHGTTINKAGAGNAPGSTAYVNHSTGQTLELFKAHVIQAGPHFALAAVVTNEALGTIRVDHHLLNGSGPARVGEELLVGPLKFLPAGPRAQAAWRAFSKSTACDRKQHGSMTPRRCRGVITRVAAVGTFGEAIETPSGRAFFVHESQLQAGMTLRIGCPVSFVPAKTPRGWSALEVRHG